MPITPVPGTDRQENCLEFKAHLGNLMGCSLKIKSKHGAGDIAQWSGTLA